MLSKTEGAEWALENMSDSFHLVIRSALKAYRSLEQRVALPNVKGARQLLGYVTSVIKELD